MKDDPLDETLRAEFQHQRQADQQRTPRWHPRWLAEPQPRQTAAQPLWHYALTALAALAFTAWWLSPSTPQLASLPPLLETQSQPLFASLPATSTASLSTDFLLPTHLNIQLP